MHVSRRRFLTYLGVAPALPLLRKILPPEDVTSVVLPTTYSLRNDAIYASGVGRYDMVATQDSTG